MIKVDIREAKAHLSRCLDQVENGEVVAIWRNNRPIAELRAIATEGVNAGRVAGLLKGMVRWEPDAFAQMSPEELAEFDLPGLLPPDPL